MPHVINTLFVNGKASRGDCPIGVYMDNENGKYRSCMSFMGKTIKLGTFETKEEAFEKYKEYKEDFIQDMAEQYHVKISHKAYDALMEWKIEITD